MPIVAILLALLEVSAWIRRDEPTPGRSITEITTRRLDRQPCFHSYGAIIWRGNHEFALHSMRFHALAHARRDAICPGTTGERTETRRQETAEGGGREIPVDPDASGHG